MLTIINTNDIDAMAKKHLGGSFGILLLRPREKRPLLIWTASQNKAPTSDQVEHIQSGNTDTNTKLITGQKSSQIKERLPQGRGSENLRPGKQPWELIHRIDRHK